MAERPQTSYDEVPYESWAFPQTHPDRLATLASLFGMDPPAIDHCRVLELGCASGGNLIPMALELPDSQFVGIDLSGRQIADGRAQVERLGLRNLDLRHLSITDVDQDLGQFDYIIAHGIYSWIPDAVQDKLLAICGQQLSSQGVAYVSYNTYPGWRMRGMIRDMMQYHARQFETSLRVPQARALLDFLSQNVPTENNAYGITLKGEVELLRQQPDHYLFHEHLEENNEPLYFYQFAERAAKHRLQYLAEADFSSMLASNFSPQVAETLRRVAPDIVRMEQYMDFLRNRTFRQTLLVRQEVRLQRDLNAHSVMAFQVASPARAVSAKPDIQGSQVEQFQAPNNATLNAGNPLTKAAMQVLSERWPQTLPFRRLRQAARTRLEPLQSPDLNAQQDDWALGLDILQAYTAAIVELRIRPPVFTLTIGERPLASPWARLQAQRGPRVTSLRHETVGLDEFSRQLLQLLNGERDREALLAELNRLVEQGVLVANQDGKPVKDPQLVNQLLVRALDQALPNLARWALLLG
ncbi:MAG: class I SAM-dependent methyltransferase [Candidatus Competibacteraceae bacterium]|nr:class I SAM-dependent methyltransferase [Candidatus Competibacteraceae bacterium]